MAVTGAVTVYAFPPGEGSAHASPRVARGEDALSRAPRPARHADPHGAGGATILEYPDGFAAQLHDDSHDHPARSLRARQQRPLQITSTGAFLAQHIAQERLSDGLSLDQHAAATAAYARTRHLMQGSIGSALDFAV